jgi:hypothetical protein
MGVFKWAQGDLIEYSIGTELGILTNTQRNIRGGFLFGILSPVIYNEGSISIFYYRSYLFPSGIRFSAVRTVGFSW